MSAAAERTPKRKIRLVGGGFTWNRTPAQGNGGSMKAKRRAERKLKKAQRKRGKR